MRCRVVIVVNSVSLVQHTSPACISCTQGITLRHYGVPVLLSDACFHDLQRKLPVHITYYTP